VSIFGNEAARFSYEGDSAEGGRLHSEFGFRVPQERSQFLYVYGEDRQQYTAVAYDGKAFLDPRNADLIKLRIRTGELPGETGACELTEELDYSRVQLHGTEFLLPTEARVTVIHTDGTEAENRIHYSACHEFLGESKVEFGASREAEESA